MEGLDKLPLVNLAVECYFLRNSVTRSYFLKIVKQTWAHVGPRSNPYPAQTLGPFFMQPRRAQQTFFFWEADRPPPPPPQQLSTPDSAPHPPDPAEGTPPSPLSLSQPLTLPSHFLLDSDSTPCCDPGQKGGERVGERRGAFAKESSEPMEREDESAAAAAEQQAGGAEEQLAGDLLRHFERVLHSDPLMYVCFPPPNQAPPPSSTSPFVGGPYPQ